MTKLESIYFILNNIRNIKVDTQCTIKAIKELCKEFKSIEVKEMEDRIIVKFKRATYLIKQNDFIIIGK